MLQDWSQMTGDELANMGDRTVVVCPLGAMESHGPHLPVGTDAMIADGILDAVPVSMLDEAQAVRLPTLWLGASLEHTTQPGTLSTPSPRFVEQIGDVVTSVATHGVRRMILFSAHGGNNAPARIAALEARANHDMLCAACHWMDLGLPNDITFPTPARADAHGGWIETSMMLAIAPDLVREPLPKPSTGTAPAELLFPDGPVNWGWMSQDLGTDGYIGTPDVATPELGRKIVEKAAQSLAQLIKQIANANWSAP